MLFKTSTGAIGAAPSLCGAGSVRHYCRVSVQAISPASRPIDAEVRVPGSKSLTNRAMCMAALASGTSTLHNALFSDDTHYFGAALRALGIEVREDADAAIISVDGQGGAIPAQKADLFVGNAGTAARFLTALLALGEGCYTVDGVPRMRERPIDELLAALTAQGARITSDSEPPRMPFTICGAGLAGGHLEISGMRSSQPISALLMVAPLARTSTTVHITGELVSKPFVGMTTRLMEQFGVNAGGGSSLYIAAGQRYHPVDMVIEPDATNASYFFAAAAVTGGRVTVAGLTRSSLQGDLAFLEVLRQMRCKVRWRGDTVTVQGPAQLTGIDVNLAPISDTAPTLAAIAPFAKAPVTIRGIAHTRLQETDRVTAMATELRRLGVPVEERDDGLRIEPAAPRPATVATYDDHRMAMAFAVTGLRAPGIAIADPGCTAKTFPDYFTRFAQLQG